MTSAPTSSSEGLTLVSHVGQVYDDACDGELVSIILEAVNPAERHVGTVILFND